MAAFVPGQEIRSDAPIMVVDAGLKPGTYRFQLVVVDDSGNASAPAFLSMTVQAAAPPPPPPSGPRFDPRIFTNVLKSGGLLNPKPTSER
jgi:hypothetical protein